MRLKDIAGIRGRPVIIIGLEGTVHDAIQKMVKNKIGALPVCDAQGKVVGIISERDLLKECAKHSAVIGQTKIEEIMTKDVISGVPEDSLDHTMRVMVQNGIRHLPIMAGSQLEGMISMRDVVQAQLEEFKEKLENTKAQVLNYFDV